MQHTTTQICPGPQCIGCGGHFNIQTRLNGTGIYTYCILDWGGLRGHCRFPMLYMECLGHTRHASSCFRRPTVAACFGSSGGKLEKYHSSIMIYLCTPTRHFLFETSLPKPTEDSHHPSRSEPLAPFRRGSPGSGVGFWNPNTET